MRIYSNGEKKLEYYCNIKSDAPSIQIALSHSLSTLKHKKTEHKNDSKQNKKITWTNETELK